MTPRSSVLILAFVLFVPMVAGARAQSPEQRQAVQRQADAQLATPKLDGQPIVTGIDLTATPVRDILAAIAKAGGITLRYHSAVANLDALSGVKLSNATIEGALHAVLDSKALAFKVTGAKSVFIYPDTAANREKYTESIRTFAIANADVNKLMQILNRAITVSPDDLRPTVVSDSESRTVTVKATPDTMAEMAKLIAANDK